MTATRLAKTQRLEARVSAHQKALIERAAAISGRSISEFVVGSLQEAAEEAIRNHHVIKLSIDDTIALMEALDNPPPANAELRRLAEEYREFFGDQA